MRRSRDERKNSIEVTPWVRYLLIMPALRLALMLGNVWIGLTAHEQCAARREVGRIDNRLVGYLAARFQPGFYRDAIAEYIALPQLRRAVLAQAPITTVGHANPKTPGLKLVANLLMR